jgi:hypothetical protein
VARIRIAAFNDAGTKADKAPAFELEAAPPMTMTLFHQSLSKDLDP